MMLIYPVFKEINYLTYEELKALEQQTGADK